MGWLDWARKRLRLREKWEDVASESIPDPIDEDYRALLELNAFVRRHPNWETHRRALVAHHLHALKAHTCELSETCDDTQQALALVLLGLERRFADDVDRWISDFEFHVLEKDHSHFGDRVTFVSPLPAATKRTQEFYRYNIVIPS